MSEELSNAPEEEKALAPPRRVILGKPSEEFVMPFPSPRVHLWKPKVRQEGVERPSFRIVITQDVLERINKHVAEDLKTEIGGFLLGDRYRCSSEDNLVYVTIDNYSEARFCSADDISMNIPSESWVQMHEEITGKYRGKKAIGWYHSHPDLGVFLSQHDVEVHQNRFSEDWNVAVVIDPCAKTGGFFCRRNGEIHPRALTEFYEIRGVNSKETYMPWLATYDCFAYTKDQLLPVNPTLAESMKQFSPDRKPVEVEEIKEEEPFRIPKRLGPHWQGIAVLVVGVLTVVIFAVVLYLWNQSLASQSVHLTPPPTPTLTATPAESPAAATGEARPSDVPAKKQTILTNRLDCIRDYECTAILKLEREPATNVQVVFGGEVMSSYRVRRVPITKEVIVSLVGLGPIQDIKRQGGSLTAEIELKENAESVDSIPIILSRNTLLKAKKPDTGPPPKQDKKKKDPTEKKPSSGPGRVYRPGDNDGKRSSKPG